MNILLDFIPLQFNKGIGGAATFAKKVCDEVISQKDADTKLFATYDSTVETSRLYNHEYIAKQANITLIDISISPISFAIEQNKIDVFFIAIGQFYARYNLTGIECKVVMFIHDIFDIERNDNLIDLALPFTRCKGKIQWIKRVINVLSGRWEKQEKTLYGNIIQLYSAQNTIPYTVSEYSAHALKYYFPNLKKEIRVCYSPMKEMAEIKGIENKQLKDMISSEQPYLFMIAANRRYKNPDILIKVFERLQKDGINLNLLTLNYGCCVNAKHTDIPFLSDSDMEHAYKHAYALVFASLFEGFGYPPIEAFKYGTPAIVSNVTSIPEITESGGIPFSPLYPADLYRAINILMKNRDLYSERAKLRYKEISTRQKNDLDRLIGTLLNKN